MVVSLSERTEWFPILAEVELGVNKRNHSSWNGGLCWRAALFPLPPLNTPPPPHLWKVFFFCCLSGGDAGLCIFTRRNPNLWSRDRRCGVVHRGECVWNREGSGAPPPREGAPSPELLKQTGLLLSHHAVCSARSSQILWQADLATRTPPRPAQIKSLTSFKKELTGGTFSILLHLFI